MFWGLVILVLIAIAAIGIHSNEGEPSPNEYGVAVRMIHTQYPKVYLVEIDHHWYLVSDGIVHSESCPCKRVE